MSSEPRSGWLEDMTRRDALRKAAAGGAALSASGLLAACGSSDSSGGGATSTGTPVPAQQKLRTGGVLRIGATGGGAKDTIDAHLPTTDPDIMRQWNMYESLAVRSPDFSQLEMLVAESIEATGSKPDAWTVRLKDGIEFHNGKTVGADDVIFSLKRITDPKDPKTGNSSLSYIDRDNLKKVDERTVRIPLKLTNAAFPDDLGQYFNAIVPTDYDPKKPVGTGRSSTRASRPASERVRQEPELLAERQALRRPAGHHRLHRRHGARQRAARRSGRGDQQPAGRPGRRDPQQPEHAGAELADRRVAAVHDAHRRGAVRRRQGAAGDAAAGRPQADGPAGAERLRQRGERPLRPLRPDVRERPAAAQPGPRAGQVAAEVRRQGGPDRRARDLAGVHTASSRRRRCSPSRPRAPA